MIYSYIYYTEILECIWSKEHISDVTANNDKICLHKELLQW